MIHTQVQASVTEIRVSPPRTTPPPHRPALETIGTQTMQAAPQSADAQRQWLNDLFAWLHAHYSGWPVQLSAPWLRAMNEAAKKMSNPSTCEVLFEDVVDSYALQPPSVRDVRVEMGPREHLVGTNCAH